MSFATAVATIQARMQANWTSTPLCFQNGITPDGAHFDPPADGVTAWVYFEVLPGSGSIAGFGGGEGNHTLRRGGVVFAHVYVPVGTGLATALAHTDAIAAIFEAKGFSGIRCYEATPGGTGSGDDEGNWFRASISIRFEFEFIG